jgi:hypothetical protein
MAKKRDGTHLAQLAGTGVVTEQAVNLIAKGKECGTVAARRGWNGRLGHEDAAAQGGSNNNIAGRIARRASRRQRWRNIQNENGADIDVGQRSEESRERIGELAGVDVVIHRRLALEPRSRLPALAAWRAPGFAPLCFALLHFSSSNIFFFRDCSCQRFIITTLI